MVGREGLLQSSFRGMRRPRWARCGTRVESVGQACAIARIFPRLCH